MYSKNLVHFILYSKHTKCRVNLDWGRRKGGREGEKEGRTNSCLSGGPALAADRTMLSRRLDSCRRDLEDGSQRSGFVPLAPVVFVPCIKLTSVLARAKFCDVVKVQYLILVLVS
jgi:hypothetical protein